jgi:hypothetical protein
MLPDGGDPMDNIKPYIDFPWQSNPSTETTDKMQANGFSPTTVPGWA